MTLILRVALEARKRRPAGISREGKPSTPASEVKIEFVWRAFCHGVRVGDVGTLFQRDLSGFGPKKRRFVRRNPRAVQNVLDGELDEVVEFRRQVETPSSRPVAVPEKPVQSHPGNRRP
ncbi:hypothetical protein ACIQOV_38090 [Kitasatospora sp. NPDC091257]|uniref:hypothetical protein n=1 Tax=Kitasatospora sp. NPDC091257 TaxID=3364084 RepID=UPI003807246C